MDAKVPFVWQRITQEKPSRCIAMPLRFCLGLRTLRVKEKSNGDTKFLAYK